MPYITFELLSQYKSFSATAENDEWKITFDGISRASPGRSFKILSGDLSFDGYDADAVIYINPRPARSVSKGISAANPFHPDQTGRDVIHVTCPTLPNERPIFQISIYLPHDAYERLIETDLSGKKIILSLENELLNQALTYGEDPDGKEIEWDVKKASYVYLREIRLNFLERDEKSNESVSEVIGEIKNEIKQIRLQAEQLDPLKSAILESIERLNRNLLKAYWFAGAAVFVAILIAVL